MEESIRMTEDRDEWRKYVHGVANPRIDDGAKEQNRTFGTVITLSLVGVEKYCDERVCLSVCLSASLSAEADSDVVTYMPSLGPRLAALRYVIYFRLLWMTSRLHIMEPCRYRCSQ